MARSVHSGGGAYASSPSPPQIKVPSWSSGAATQRSTSLQGLINSMLAPENQQTTQVTQQLPSPELESQIQGFQTDLNQLSQGFQQAAGDRQSSFNDVIRSLSSTFNQQAGAASTGVASAALGSGLSPLEASQLGSDTRQKVQQQFFPQQAALKAQQAAIPTELQRDLTGLQQMNSNFIGQTVAPFLQAQAGQETITQNPQAALQAAGQLAAHAESMAQQASQFESQQDLAQQQMVFRQAQLEQQMSIALMQAAQAAASAQQAAQSQATRLVQELQIAGLDYKQAIAVAQMQAQTSLSTSSAQIQAGLQKQYLEGQQQLQQLGLTGQNQLLNTGLQNQGGLSEQELQNRGTFLTQQLRNLSAQQIAQLESATGLKISGDRLEANTATNQRHLTQELIKQFGAGTLRPGSVDLEGGFTLGGMAIGIPDLGKLNTRWDKPNYGFPPIGFIGGHGRVVGGAQDVENIITGGGGQATPTPTGAPAPAPAYVPGAQGTGGITLSDGTVLGGGRTPTSYSSTSTPTSGSVPPSQPVDPAGLALAIPPMNSDIFQWLQQLTPPSSPVPSNVLPPYLSAPAPKAISVF